MSSTQRDSESRWHRIHVISTVASTVAALTATILTAYTLLFLVNPNLKPIEEVSIEITKVELGARMPYTNYVNQYVEEAKAGPHAQDPRFGTALGIVAYVKIRFKGAHRNHGEYSTQLMPVDSVTYSELGHTPAGFSRCSGAFAPAWPQDSTVLRCWMSLPGKKGSYFIRAEVYDFRGDATFIPGKSVLFDFAFSRKFDHSP